MADMRMLSDEIIRLQGELKSCKPGTDDYQKRLQELKALQELEDNDAKIGLEAAKVDNDKAKIENDRVRIKSEEKRENKRIVSSIVGGGGLILLGQLLESEHVVRSKVWQTGTRIFNKFL